MHLKKLKVLLILSIIAIISLININDILNKKISLKDTKIPIDESLSLLKENTNISSSGEFWYKDAPIYREFTEGKHYEENFILEKYYKISYDNSILNRVLLGSGPIVEELKKSNFLDEVQEVNNNLFDLNPHKYIQLTLDINKWKDNYDITTSYSVLDKSLLFNNSLRYMEDNYLFSNYSKEFSVDPKSILAFNQSENIYNNSTSTTYPKISTGVGIISMEIPFKNELSHKNHKGMLSYTLKRSFDSYGSISTNYSHNNTNFNGSISMK